MQHILLFDWNFIEFKRESTLNFWNWLNYCPMLGKCVFKHFQLTIFISFHLNSREYTTLVQQYLTNILRIISRFVIFIFNAHCSLPIITDCHVFWNLRFRHRIILKYFFDCFSCFFFSNLKYRCDYLYQSYIRFYRVCTFFSSSFVQFPMCPLFPFFLPKEENTRVYHLQRSNYSENGWYYYWQAYTSYRIREVNSLLLPFYCDG